ncbi:MAG TPA: hypothetical protein VEY91_12605, partial [Candidatus Limnocylindria bacterium]|nr:hypothetical protein [Candidatus Limnocylindria bacterium]
DRFAYRLVLGSGPDAFTTPEVWVDVPSEVAFSLRGVHPNPNPGDQLLVSFSLAEREPATLELVDVSGRRVSEHTIDSPEPRASSNAALEDCRPAFISSGSARVRADSPPSCAWSANGGPRSGSPRSILSTWGQRELAMRSVFPATRRAPSASQPATAPGP